MDRIICNIKVDELEPNVLVITPFHNKGFDANSIYEFKLPDIKAKNGSILKSQKIKFILVDAHSTLFTALVIISVQ